MTQRGLLPERTVISPLTPMPVELAASMLGIYVGESEMIPTMDQIKHPTTLIITPTGVNEIRANPNFQVVRTPKIPIGVRITHKLPWVHFGRIVGLFKACLPNEAVTYLWWRPREDGSLEWQVTVPPQRVSQGSAKPKDGRAIAPDGDGWTRWGDIHSHNTMNAFFSTTDDADEQTDGLIYGVVGKVNQVIPEFKFRVRAMGQMIDVSMESVIGDIPAFAAPPQEWLDNLDDRRDFGRDDRDNRSTGSTGSGSSHSAHNSGFTVTDRRGRHKDYGPKRLIRTDGSVWTLFSDGFLQATAKRIEDLRHADRVDALVEGIDWHAKRKES